jgi:adenine deaminase
MIRRAIELGVDPVEAIRMASLNPSEWFRLPHLGAIAPGRVANLVVFDDLAQPSARLVFSRGELVARDGGALPDVDWGDDLPADASLGHCVADWSRIDLSVPARSNRVRLIVHRQDQLVTDRDVVELASKDGQLMPDVSRDVLKMAVIERHRGTGQVGIGFISGIGLRRGAIAGTIAHDHHNLVVIGADDASMRVAGEQVTRMGGGLCVADAGRVVASLPLPIGGLMSDRPVAEVAERYDALVRAARDLGSPLADPFMAMSFMALEVIPSLKLTDLGLVDVDDFKRVELFV